MEIKQEFNQLCQMIYISSNGFAFPFEDVEHDGDLSGIRQSPNYPILKEKMQNLLNLINSNAYLIERDIENELWDLI